MCVLGVLFSLFAHQVNQTFGCRHLSSSAAGVVSCVPPSLRPKLSPLSHGGGRSEVREEFETEAHHKVPDVSGHLGPGYKDAPNEHHQDGVEGVTDVSQPGGTKM